MKENNVAELSALILFGVAFGFVEAAVVYYLRDLLDFHAIYSLSGYRTLLNLGFITFLAPNHAVLVSHAITIVETAREGATIVMLAAVAFLAGKDSRQRIGAFLVSFACWDVFYYVFLKLLTNWPGSLRAVDIYFLIPVVWVGPVVTPLVASAVIFILGTQLYLRRPAQS